MLAVALGAAVLLLSAPAEAPAQVRKSINALTAPELEALRRGVAVMKSRDGAPRNSADWRRSWVFWANLHGHFGSGCDGPVTGDGMQGVIAWTATNAQERNTWCSCQHRNDSFLTWHRLAVYQFERVLQQAAGAPTLRLPYWDYAADPALPEAFRNPTYVNEQGQTVANPLYLPQRAAALNAGTAGIAASASSAANAMAATSYKTFRTRLENTPHGAVHCAVSVSGCPSGYMGSLSTAALDPIFWAHHANIDRLYDCWSRSGSNRLPTGALLNRTYRFPDETGRVVSIKVRDGLTPAQLGYSYSVGSSCSGVGAEAPALDPAGGGAVEAASAGSGAAWDGVVGDGDDAASPALARAAEAGAELWLAQNRPRATLPTEAQSRGRRPKLRLENVVPDALQPGMYDVYMVAPDGRRALVGTMSFFAEQGDEGAAPAGHAGHAGHGATPAGRDFDFDLTRAARELGLRPGASFEVSFVATTGLAPLAPRAAGGGQAIAVERRGAPPRIGRLRVEAE